MQIEGFKRSIAELSVMAGSADDDDNSLRLMVTEWTNEKHCLYLKSMEATFINQLHNSIDSLGRSSLRVHSTHLDTDSSSGQFKVLRSGCWEKVNFKKGEAQANNADGPCARPRALLANPWIRHFKSSAKHENFQTTRKNQLEESTKLFKSLGTKSKHFPSCHSQLRSQDSDDNNEEESAQNFVNEEYVERGVVEGTSSSKRIKTLVVNESSNDQVVPKDECPERR